jgi:hypothetical protein
MSRAESAEYLLAGVEHAMRDVDPPTPLAAGFGLGLLLCEPVGVELHVIFVIYSLLASFFTSVGRCLSISCVLSLHLTTACLPLGADLIRRQAQLGLGALNSTHQTFTRNHVQYELRTSQWRFFNRCTGGTH